MSFRNFNITRVNAQDNINLHRATRQFARRIARCWYHCEPSRMPETVLVAHSQTNILATVGLFWGSDIKPFLPLQALYQLGENQLLSGQNWENTLQLSWFFAEEKGVFPSLLHIALQFALTHGKHYALLQAKKPIAQLLSRRGMQLFCLQEASLQLSAIPEEERNYYNDNTEFHLYALAIQPSLQASAHYLRSEHLPCFEFVPQRLRGVDKRQAVNQQVSSYDTINLLSGD